ncbi:TRAP transporter small permease [Halobacillus shinanisalinarum]|uniref:TRAP transporter small permease n=1 Tax=Halobacillus shinanisalinarum TaxID=2932258 RepID=A0ABY4GUN7_9BACI|nr:TRAP transporter small permease [Halobacillus shinanisalinarum]UOQ91838.1 TRAP transporter small permease [Halobacillus shinanisalinarum]
MNILNKIDSLMFCMAKVSIFICMFLITINAAMRYLFNKPLTGTYEFIELFLMVILVFLSLSYTWKLKGFISITVLFNKFPLLIKNLIYFGIIILGVCFFSLIGYEGYATTVEKWLNNEVSSGVIPWPLFLSTVWVPLGCLMIVLRMFLELVIGVRNIFSIGIRSDIFEMQDEIYSNEELE